MTSEAALRLDAPVWSRNLGDAVSEERIVPDAAEFTSAASKTTVFWTNIFQSLLVLWTKQFSAA